MSAVPEIKNPTPVKIGDTVEVKIEKVRPNGDGVSNIDWFTVLVQGGSAKAGEKVKVCIIKLMPTFAVGVRV